MTTPEAKATYRRRKEIVEPVFGIMKEQQHARRFLLRGMDNVKAEWTLPAVAFILRSLWGDWKERGGLLASAKRHLISLVRSLYQRCPNRF